MHPRRATCVPSTRAFTHAHAAAQALLKVADERQTETVRACTRRSRACVPDLWRREGGEVLAAWYGQGLTGSKCVPRAGYLRERRRQQHRS